MSQIANERVNKVSDVLTEGQSVKVKLLGFDDRGKVRLSMKVVDQETGDGTLVDTNYHHAIAWFRAFRRNDVTVPVWRVHRHIGMGGDQLVAAVAGDEVEEKLGDAIRNS